jgi:hypothetical protein
MLISLAGCASKSTVNSQKIFQQALVLQQARPDSTAKATKTADDFLLWTFSDNQFSPHMPQITELYQWLSQAGPLQGYRLQVRTGPDWLSSYKRGNAIRAFIPRGLSINQTYNAAQAPHTVELQLQPLLLKSVTSTPRAGKGVAHGQ